MRYCALTLAPRPMIMIFIGCTLQVTQIDRTEKTESLRERERPKKEKAREVNKNTNQNKQITLTQSQHLRDNTHVS